MPASAVDCEAYVRAEIERVDKIPNEFRRSEHYVKSHTLLYAWLLQRTNAFADRAALKVFLGPSVENLVDNFIDYDLVYHYATKIKPALILTDEMMGAIERVYSGSPYHIASPVPCFGGSITGIDLIELMNELQLPPAGTSVPDLLSQALKHALPEIDIRSVNVESPHIRLVSGPSDSWHFLLAVAPHRGALTEKDSFHLVLELTNLRTKLRVQQGIGNSSLLNILLLTSAIDNAEEVRFLRETLGFYYGWSLTNLRFFHLLEPVISGKEPEAASEFLAIFENQSGLAFSSSAAVAELKKKL